MISIRSNFFYTRSVPCELWFFDKGKPKEMLDKILMIDARNIYRRYQDSRRIFEFSPEQLKNITAMVWLYRGETEKYLNLIKEYLNSLVSESLLVENIINDYNSHLSKLNDKVNAFSKVIGKNKDLEKDKIEAFKNKLDELKEINELYEKKLSKFLNSLNKYLEKHKNNIPEDNTTQIKMNTAFDPLHDEVKGITKYIDSTFKHITGIIEFSEKELGAKETDEWEGREIYKLTKEIHELRKYAIEQLKDVVYFHKIIIWLQEKFPEAKFENVEGLVKLVNRKEVKENDWSLTPGRYVGVAKEPEDDDFDFGETIKEIHDELEILNIESNELVSKIYDNFKGLEI